MARVLVLKPETMSLWLKDCEDLDDFYAELECHTFDIARRRIGKNYYDIFCDDIGLYREKPVISAVNADGEPMLVGNLIFANHDGQGNTTDLSDEDIVQICAHAVPYLTEELEHGLAVVCEY